MRDRLHRTETLTFDDRPCTNAMLPPHLEVVRVLGRGGMGVVYEVQDHRLGRRVAVKVMRRPRSPMLVERFVREARALAALRHPALVTVHDVEPDGAYMIMELVQGETLAARLAAGPLSWSEVLPLARHLIGALALVHAHGIVHRDIKPDNIVIGDDGMPRLLDFGVAHVADDAITRSGIQIGTPRYAAPEQLRGEDITPAADVYALGVTLFEALTGTHPETVRALGPALEVATSSGRVASVLARTLAHAPDDRYPDARVLGDALAATVRPQRRHRRGIAAVAVLAFAVTGLANRTRGQAATTAPPVIVALPLAGAASDPLLVHALPDLVTEDLRAMGLVVRGHLDARRALGEATSPTEWRRRLGPSSTLVETQLEPTSDDHVALTLSVRRGDGTRPARYRWVGPRTDVLGGAHALAAQLGTSLGGTRLTAPRSPDVERLVLAIRDSNWRRNYKRSRELLYAGLGRHPDDPGLLFLAAIVAWWDEDPMLGRVAARYAATSHMTTRDDALIAGAVALVEARFPDAIAIFERLARDEPRDPDILYGLGEAYVHAGRAAEMIRVHRLLSELSPAYGLLDSHAIEWHLVHGDLRIAEQLASALGTPAATAAVIALAHRDYAAVATLVTRPGDSAYHGGLAVLARFVRRQPLEAVPEHSDAATASALAWFHAAARGTATAGLWRAAVADAPRHKPWVWAWLAPSLAIMGLEVGIPSDELEAGLARSGPVAQVGDDVARAIIAARTGQPIVLADATSPEVRAVARAAAAAPGEAVALWQRALAASTAPNRRIVLYQELARAAAAVGDHATLADACEEIVTPRYFDVVVFTATAACKRWLAESAR